MSRARVAAGAALCATLGLAAGGCAWLGAPWLPPRLGECPGPLVPAGEIPGGDFVLRERVRVRGGEVDLGLLLVAERRGDRLVLVAFNPFGAKAFSVVQEGLDVEATSHLGPALPVPPGNVLRDLHAARFAGPADTPERVEVARPGCGYTATFARVERRPLP